MDRTMTKELWTAALLVFGSSLTMVALAEWLGWTA